MREECHVVDPVVGEVVDRWSFAMELCRIMLAKGKEKPRYIGLYRGMWEFCGAGERIGKGAKNQSPAGFWRPAGGQ
jgi:hypothetical protein